MFANVYGDKRALIVCGKYEGTDKLAADYLYSELSAELPYVLTICEAEKLTDDMLKYYSIVAVGTAASNSFIADLCKKGLLQAPTHKEGYRIKVMDNPYNPERQIFALVGGSEVGAYYAVSHFVNKYLPECGDGDFDSPEADISGSDNFLFAKKITEMDIYEQPQIAERGIWTWGHVIYNHKAFLNNMARLRMNIITVWNDFVPINAKEFVDYAHSLGIKVIWGFSMGWGYSYDISDDAVLDKIIDDAVENYRNNYLPLGGDGAYFQTFTETKESSINGVNIAERVSVFVNKINVKFKENFGDIRIQFGLHATSVKNSLNKIAEISPDMEIAWEDCGSFPYSYNPDDIKDFAETLAFTEKIVGLRGENEIFSAVLKAQSTLSWPTFEHQMGTFNMGVTSNRYIESKYSKKKKFWRQKNARWIKNGEKAREIIEVIRKKTNGSASLEFLIEAGVFEYKISLASAISAQLMWNSNREYTQIIYEAGLMSDVEF